MKVNYTCEYCGKRFDTQDEAINCEQKHIEEQKERERLKQEKEIRYNEVQEAYKKYNELIRKYNEDYGVFPSSKIGFKSPLELFFF